MGINLGHIEIAKSLMQEIMYDNGCVNRFEKEKYPNKWVVKIADKAAIFFDNNENCLTNEHIEQIVTGEYEYNNLYYGNMVGYSELNKILNEYFESL